MGKGFRALFYVPKYAKVRENVLLARLVVTGITIAACLFAMCFAAFAYFTCSVTSGSNILIGASYSMEVIPPDQAVISQDGYVLQAGDTDTQFAFTLQQRGTATVGYCKIQVRIYEPATQVLHTVQQYTHPIGMHLVNGHMEVVAERTVTITVPAGYAVTVTFRAQWGSCALTEGIGEQLDLTTLGLLPIPTEPEPTEPEPTEPEPTEPEPTEPEPTEPEPTEPEGEQ